jgi:transcription initiation factor TFIIB
MMGVGIVFMFEGVSGVADEGLLNTYAEALKLPEETVERARELYSRVVAAGLLRGRSRDGFIAASILAALRLEGWPVTSEDVAVALYRDFWRSAEKRIRNSYRLILRALNLSPPAPDAELFTTRYANILGFDEGVRERALNIVRAAKELQYTQGKNSKIIALAALYLASSRTLHLDYISRRTPCSKQAVKERALDLMAKIGENIP